MSWSTSMVLWAVAIALAFVGVRRLWRIGHSWWRGQVPSRSCPRCAYDLRGSSGRTCPECAHTARSERALKPGWRRARGIAAATILLVLAAAIVRFDAVAHRDGLDAALPRSVGVVMLWAVPWMSPLPWFRPWTDYDGGSLQALDPDLTGWERRVLRDGALRRLRSRDPVVQSEGLWLYAALLPDPGLLRDRDRRAIHVLLEHSEPDVRQVAAIVAAHGVDDPLADQAIVAVIEELDLENPYDLLTLHPILGAMLRHDVGPAESFVAAVIELLGRGRQARVSGRRLAERSAVLGHQLPELVEPLMSTLDADHSTWNALVLDTAWLHADDQQRARVAAAIERLLDRGDPIDMWDFMHCLEDPRFSPTLRRGILRHQLADPNATLAIGIGINPDQLSDADVVELADDLLAAISRVEPGDRRDWYEPLRERIERLREQER